MVRDVTLALFDLLGEDYLKAVAAAATALHGLAPEQADRLARERVSFCDGAFRARQDELLPMTGKPILPSFENDNAGAPTDSFAKASHLGAAPLTGVGLFRLGEDGCLYLAGKSEHYHTPLGHNFPGYRLIDNARALGIVNATHNNTRGYVTRRMERELVRCANGLTPGDGSGLAAVLMNRESRVLNRVINLQTGSLAVEAGVKMMLARFYKLDAAFPPPPHAGRTPVFLVLADQNGGPEANYHGTTVITQTMRGLWPGFREKAEKAGLCKVVPVSPNDADGFAAAIARYNEGPFRTAGFLHEIILMNYGALRLEPAFLQAAYRLCALYDTPTLVDEIQSCMWYPGMFLYRLYGLKPDFVILGKGFSGGQYAASKILTTAPMDGLNQFGALVTNGQEELASLSYLITMAYAEANAEALGALGAYFEAGLAQIKTRFPALVARVEGRGHLAALHFHTLPQAAAFARAVSDGGIDVSAQTYKANCPPAVLFKLPWIASEKAMDFVLSRMERALSDLA